MHKNLLLSVGITILFLGMSFTILGSNILDYTLTPELIINGPAYGHRGQPLEYTLILTGQGECEIWYYVNWDDGANTTWLGPYEPGEELVISHRWYYTDIYTISAVAKGCNGTYYYAILDVVINDPPSPPEIDGPTYGLPCIEYDYTFVVPEWDMDMIWIYIDWDDGTFEDWIGPFDGFEEVIVSHSWPENRIYELRAKAMDYFNESNWATYVVNIGDEPPDKPYIDGPHHWPVGEEISFTFHSSDPDGDNVKYIIDWGDGTTIETDYVPSCTPVEVCHTWENIDEYLLKARAKDIYNYASDWTIFEIEIPRPRLKTNLWYQWFLERFPMLERLLFLLK